MSNPSLEYRDHPWMGVFPATLCSFHPDESLDEEGLRAYFAWLCRVPGLKGLVCNGHTGEIMARWLYDYERLKAAAPRVTIITCHDEYLLPTLLEAGDGALIGFAGFAPELMVRLVDACVAGDLDAAKEAQRMVAPLARLIYNFGEPGCSAHQRMKIALWLLGQFSSPVFRRPTRPLTSKQIERIRVELQAIGLNLASGIHEAAPLEPVGLRVVA